MRLQGEVEPAEGERERDGKRAQHTPKDRHVRDPAEQATLEDERLGKDIGPLGFRYEQSVVPKVAQREKINPASAEVPPGRRSANPERVAIGQSDEGKECRNGVANQGRIEVTQPS